MHVVCCQPGGERGFVSSMLVAGTALGVATLPVWVYVAKGFGG